MDLSTDLISEFIKATNDTRKEKVDTTTFGTTVVKGDKVYVKLDGSELYTPVSTTAHLNDGERVMVTIKNHTAIVTGNISSPAVNLQTNIDNGDGTTVKLSDLGISIRNGILRVDKLEANSLTADSAVIKDLQTNKLSADSAVIKDLQANSLTAESAIIKNLQTDKLEADSAIIKDLQTNSLTAESAIIKSLQADKLDAETANITYATIKSLEAVDLKVTNLSATHGNFETLTTENFTAVNASISKLDTDKLNVTAADIKYATIESLNATNANIKAITAEKIFAESGVIKDLTMKDGYVTGELVGVTMKGDLIEAGTLVADRLIISGEDGLYYELNTNGMTVTANQTEYNSLNGSVITAKSVTADKIKVTDLVAFGATIANFKIDENAIYSGVKSTVSDDTTGLYLGSDGQVAFGDGINYLKYFKDTDNAYKLILGIGNENVSNVIEATANGLFIGNQSGNNIVIDTTSFDICKGSDVLASYSSNKVELGRNNKKTVIDLCNGTAQISNIADEDTDYNRLKIYSEDSINLEALGVIEIGTSSYKNSILDDFSTGRLMIYSDSPWITDNQVTSMVNLGCMANKNGVQGESSSIAISAELSMTPYSTKLSHVHTQSPIDTSEDTYRKWGYIEIEGCLGDSNSDGTQSPVSEWYNKITISADKTAITGELSVDGACIIGKWNAHTSLIAYADTTIIGSCNINDGNLVVRGSHDTSGYWTSGGSAEFEGDLTLTSAEYTDDVGECFRPSAIYGKKYSNGIWRGPVEVLVPQDENGDLLIGRGVSSTFSTTDCTRIYGYDVYLYSRAADLTDEYGAAYRPYYRGDDSIDVFWYGGGYVSNDHKTVYFSIPLGKPVIGNPTVTVTSRDGIAVRQGGSYCYGGSASSQYVEPTSYSAALVSDGTSIRIQATMPNTTNAINNEACGIAASIKISFKHSY